MRGKSPKTVMIELAESVAAASTLNSRHIHRRRLEGNPKYPPGSVISGLSEEKRETLKRLKSDDLANVLFRGDVFTDDAYALQQLSRDCMAFDRRHRLVGR